mgnify:FL=1
MKLNKKGYTLIELLVVIVVIGLILGFATFGIIKAYNNSKGKASDISEGSIIDAGETYANEKTNDENYWKNIIDKEEKYFCVTIEELMNKGLLDKKANIKSDKFNIHSYVLVKKNKVTSVNSNGEILTDINSDDYKVCSGSISDEKIISYPKLDKGDSYTDEIDAPFSDAITDSEDEITDRVCMYGDSSANIKETGTIEGNDCKLLGLKQNSIYYLRVCMKTSRGNYLCSNTESRTTKKIKDPIITINNNVNIEYKNDGINGEAGYYFNSTIKGTSNKDVQECTLSNNIFTCQDGNTKEIKGFTWYKTLDNNINITHTENGNGKITARTLDKSNNMAESVKEISVYKIVFKKGTADTIGGVATDIEKLCTAEKSKTCSVTSPSVEKNGYEIIGWNTSNSATTSSWNVNTSKSISTNSTYYPITKLNTYTVSYNANGGSGAPASQTKTTNNNLTLSSVKPTRVGYTFQGWGTSSSATTATYQPGETYSDNKSITLYAVWKINKVNIKFSTNSGTVQTSSTNASGNIYKWKQDSSGVVSRTAANGSTYSNPFFTLNYGSSTDRDGLPNYNNSKYLNITKTGHNAISGQEWKCLSGCTLNGKVFNQATVYKASDFCDASKGDCTVTLGVNWVASTYTITLDSQGATSSGTTKVYYQYNTTKTINGTVCYYYTNSTLTNCLSNGYNITKPTKTNHTFSGYYTGTNGSGTNYVNSSGTFINNVYKTTGNRTLYAKWTLNTKKMYVNDINGLYCMSKSGGGERIRLFSCGDVITVKANSEPNGWYYVPNLGCYSSGEYLSDTLTVNCSGGTPSGSGCGIPCSCNGKDLVFSSSCTADQKSYYMKKYYCRNGYVYNRDNNQIASGCA